MRGKFLIVTLFECLKSKIGNPEKAFSIFDANFSKEISVNEFERVIITFGKDSFKEVDIHTLLTIAKGDNENAKTIRYKDFCDKFFDSKRIRTFKAELSLQDIKTENKLFKQANVNYVV
jgi:Ca2+-binding EF-hand superfamily protein